MKNTLHNAWHSLWHNPSHFVAAILMRYNSWIPNEMYIKLMYRLELGRKLDLIHPIRYNDKMQWLKLYNHRLEYVAMADKINAKMVAAKLVGERYIIPTLGVWNRPEQIEWDKLPNQFVLKTNHDSGNSGVVVIKDAAKLQDLHYKRQIIRRLNQSLRKDAFAAGREWPYKNIERKVFAEQYMEDQTTHDLRDYKFYCIGGKPIFLFVATERNVPGEIAKFDYFDMDFNPLDLRMAHPKSGCKIDKPICFEEMKQLAERLSQGIPTIRIDLYEVNGKVYFGEFTFFPSGGLAAFHPDEWDYRLGEMVVLPEKTI